MLKRVGMVSLGCPKNQIDSEVMLGILKEAGFDIVNQSSRADIIIVNTCCFIDPAKEESIDAIIEQAQYKKIGNCKMLIVTGCMAQRYRMELLQEIPEIDAIVGTGNFTEIVKVIKEASTGKKIVKAGDINTTAINGRFPRILTTSPYTAYLKIAEGCDNMCTYCIIPRLRGRFRSRDMDVVVEEAEQLVAKGVRELILVAQDITRYGQDFGNRFSLVKLLERLVAIPELKWLRLLYCYPGRITDELIDTIAREEKICNYIDVPLQHINADILKRMNRHIAPGRIKELIERIRKNIPNVIIRTSFIVGFPGEGEEEFNELVNFIREFHFDRAGFFAYSREEGTPAARYANQVDDKTKERRIEKLSALQQEISRKLNVQRLGSVCEVLIEGVHSSNLYVGRSYGEAPEIDGQIFVSSPVPLHIGDFVKVRITGAYEYDLSGEVI